MARRPHRQIRLLLVPALSVALLGGTAGILLPTAAYADLPGQIRATQARIDALNTRAEQAAERYDAGQIALTRARQVAAGAAGRLARDNAAVETLRSQAGSFAAQVYRGSTTQSLQLLSAATTPAAMMNGLSALNHVAKSQAEALAALSTARHRQAQSAAAAKAALADQQQVVRRLERDKASVLRDARAAEQLLGELQAKQAALVKAAADAAARRAAQRRADELAAQARASASALLAFSQRQVDGPSGPSVVHTQHYSGDAAQVAVRVAEDQLGKSYEWGAEGPNTFDCSGLTKYAYAAAGIALPHYTGEQWNAGRHVAESDLQPGDLIFFHSDLHHMGMYIGGGQLIHAPHTGDVVRIASLSGWFQDNYAGAVRVAG